MRDPPANTTIKDLLYPAGWVWLYCTSCDHRKAIRVRPLIEKRGPDTPSDVLREKTRCEKCGHVGAQVIAPSWDVQINGWAKFPGE